MNESDQLLAAAPVPMAFFKLAIPAVAAQLINILYNLVDKMFIGHIPEVGKQALAGGGVTAPVILTISAFAALVSMGGAPKAIFLTIWRRSVLLIPLIFLLPRVWPDAVTGVYMAEPIADTIAVCTTAPMFYAYYRKLKYGSRCFGLCGGCTFFTIQPQFFRRGYAKNGSHPLKDGCRDFCTEYAGKGILTWKSSQRRWRWS